MAAAAVDREFWCVQHASFELTLKCPGMLWGAHCAHLSLFGEPLAPLKKRLWCTLGNLGAHFGPPGAALGRPGCALKLLWECLGTILALIGEKVSAGTPIASRWLSSTAPAHKNKPTGICPPVPVKRSTNYSSGPTFHTRQGSG